VKLGRPLPRSFYAENARAVAPRLLNKLLVHHEPGRDAIAGRIVEVEAYLGVDDPGSHAFRGPTPRSSIMFGPPGVLYVYFTYGMHWCANAVCCPAGVASAVLLRALAPVAGIEAMRAARPAARRDRDLCSGPARLCQALGLTGDHNGTDLVRGRVTIRDDGVAPPDAPGVSTRIGLANGGEHRWRFYVPGDPNVSAARPGTSGRR
jgi:DNA-3-methyladenine glycosylase